MSNASIDDFGNRSSALNYPTKKTEVQEKEKDIITPNQWTFVNNNVLVPCTKTIPVLKSGYYEVVSVNNSVGFKLKEIKTDELIKFPDSLSAQVLDEIGKFWKLYERFTKFGFLHRRGYLFYGPPGSGKTCLVKQIVEQIVNSNGIVFDCRHPGHLSRALEMFRTVEPNRQIVCTFEDLDAIIRDYGEDALLSLLDGENQVDRVLNIATTNYPESLDRRLIARPRRFDRVYKIDMPSHDHRKIYFENKLDDDVKKDMDIDLWVKETDKFSFAHLSELIVSVFCLGNEFEKSVQIMRKLIDKKASSNEYSSGGKAGFGS